MCRRARRQFSGVGSFDTFFGLKDGLLDPGAGKLRNYELKWTLATASKPFHKVAIKLVASVGARMVSHWPRHVAGVVWIRHICSCFFPLI